MGKLWFSADHHFGHKNIIDYCERPWASVEEMNEGLAKLWNENVGGQDRVIYLGDFALDWHGPERYLKGLNGWIDPFVLGNHDRQKEWKRVEGSLVGKVVNRWLEVVDGVEVLMEHKPSVELVEWAEEHPKGIVVYGHIHNNPAPQHWPRNAVNVGVDVWGWKPVSWEEVREKAGV